MLPRTLEPEVMDTAEEAADYDAMDHSEVNRRFVDDWGITSRAKGHTAAATRRMLDVGTGTALIPIEFCRSDPSLRIVAIDLATEMLKLAAANVERAGFSDPIELRLVDAKRIPCADGEFETVVSNSIIHHIPQPLDSLTEMVRVLAPGGLLFVRDLMRPATETELEALVQTYTQGATPSMRQLFRQSLHAALTVDEVAEMLGQLGLSRDWVRATSDRHWTISGVLPLAEGFVSDPSRGVA
jgi:ubiquinone/menaquinone biosynthesis C-methylase UbiE